VRKSVMLRIDRGGKPELDRREHHHGQSGPQSPRCPCQSALELYPTQEANPPDSRRAFSQASTSRSSQRKAEPTRIAGGPSPRMRHARKHPTLTVRRSATCLMVRSRGAAPIECDCPIDFFITISSADVLLTYSLAREGRPSTRIQRQRRRLAARVNFGSDPRVRGTPWRDHPPQQQFSATTWATFAENRLGHRLPARAIGRQRMNRLRPQCAQPCAASVAGSGSYLWVMS
jgi:hypothetical protein